MRFSMHTTFLSKTAVLSVTIGAALIISGCASPAPPRSGPSMDAIYGSANRLGQKDAVETMRRGIKTNLQGGGN